MSASKTEESRSRLLGAYLDAVALSEAIQTRIWHAAQLTLAQVRVLRRLARQPRSLGQLGADLALAPPSMTRLVDRLEERGLIARSRDAEDRRKVLVTLTAEGRQLIGAIPFLEGTPIRAAVDRMTVGRPRADRSRDARVQRGGREGGRRVAARGDRRMKLEYKWIVLINTTIGMLMASINQTIVLISLPAIFSGLHVDPLAPGQSNLLLWMLMGYSAVTTVLLVTFGRIADMFGRVRIYNLGFVVFTIGSLLCAVTPVSRDTGAIELIAFRMVQGVGGACLFANSIALLTDAFPASQRGFSLGINQIAFIAGNVVGVVLGGILAADQLAPRFPDQRSRRPSWIGMGIPRAPRDWKRRRSRSTGWAT